MVQMQRDFGLKIGWRANIKARQMKFLEPLLAQIRCYGIQGLGPQTMSGNTVLDKKSMH